MCCWNLLDGLPESFKCVVGMILKGLFFFCGKLENYLAIYLKLPGFLPDFFQEESPAKEYFEKVYAEFENINQKKDLIIDFRNCPGGVTVFPLLLLYSLYAGTESVVPGKIYDARQLESKIIYKSSESIETRSPPISLHHFFSSL